MNQQKINKQRRRRVRQIQQIMKNTTSQEKKQTCRELINALEKLIKQNTSKFRSIFRR